MFIAHLPAGYLLTRFVVVKRGMAHIPSFQYRTFMALGLIGSLLPDVDMLYFYLIDNRQHLHHGYWTHIPLSWLMLSGVTLLIGRLLRKPLVAPAAIVLFSNVFVHLFLDTVAGKIPWLYPVSSHAFVLFDVPARYDWWVWNFVFHWTFLFEVTITGAALFMFLRSRSKTG
ncbi:MAG: metal-dependent hydrolase [Nitrospirota bacterium]